MNLNIDKIKEFMAKKKYSEQEFADLMGIHHTCLFRVLRGKRRGGGKFIRGLLNAGMKPKDIFISDIILSNDNTSTRSTG